jgi:hypothetical protein
MVQGTKGGKMVPVNGVTGVHNPRCKGGCGGRFGVYYDTASWKIIPPGLKRAKKSATILPTLAEPGSETWLPYPPVGERVDS